MHSCYTNSQPPTEGPTDCDSFVSLHVSTELLHTPVAGTSFSKARPSRC
jgi:hypothetical protein